MADGDWKRLAKLIRARRKKLRMTQAQLGAASGTSEPTVRHLEAIVRTTFGDDTTTAIAEALGWTPDSIDRILAGGEPVEADPSEAPLGSEERMWAAIRELQRQVAELRERDGAA